VNRILDINVSVTTSVTTVYFHYQELSGDGKINVFSSKINPNYCLVAAKIDFEELADRSYIRIYCTYQFS